MANLSVGKGKKRNKPQKKFIGPKLPIGPRMWSGAFNSDNDPLAMSAKAQLAPFHVPRGMAKKSDDAQYSQAVSATASSTVVVPAGSILLFAQDPCAASDGQLYSCAFVVTTLANQSNAGSGFTVPTGVTSVGTRTGMATNTPYSSDYLQSISARFRLVGAGLRIRNVTENLYRGGLLRYVMDDQGTSKAGLSANSTVNDWLNSINSHQATVRKSFTRNDNIDLFYPTTELKWQQCDAVDAVKGTFMLDSEANAISGGVNSGGDDTVTYTTVGTVGVSTYHMGTTPSVYGYFYNGSSGSQSLDFSTVEHYEYYAKSLSALHTPSPNHPNTQAAVNTLQNHVITNHAHHPDASQHTVLGAAAKLVHNRATMNDAKHVFRFVLDELPKLAKAAGPVAAAAA